MATGEQQGIEGQTIESRHRQVTSIESVKLSLRDPARGRSRREVQSDEGVPVQGKEVPKVSRRSYLVSGSLPLRVLL